MSYLTTALLFLAAAVLLVPLCRKLNLGAVLGYLLAGILIGPSGLQLVGHVDEVLHISELGVILLLFIIGLELQPSRLWVLRRSVFGLGAAQLLLDVVEVVRVAVPDVLPQQLPRGELAQVAELLVQLHPFRPGKSER